MSQSHTRRAPRRNVLEGYIARQKREHAEQRRKFWKSLLPVAIAAVLLGLGYHFGVTTK